MKPTPEYLAVARQVIRTYTPEMQDALFVALAESRVIETPEGEPHSDAQHRAGYREDCPACKANDARIAAYEAADR